MEAGMQDVSSVAVVGGGIAGLIAAIALARGGATVTLFERASALGGRATSRVEEGFVFNQGPHALYNAGKFAESLAAFGVAVTGGPPDFREAVAIWGNDRHPLPRNFATIAAGAPLNFAERIRMLRLFTMLPHLDLYAWRGRPFSEYAGGLPARPRALVLALTRLSTYAHAPDALDAAAALAQIQLAAKGVVYIDGGWGALVEGLANVARAAGVDIKLASPVVIINRAAGKWRLGLDAATPFIAEAVVLAAPPAAAAALLPTSALLAAAVREAAPIRAISLDYALRRLPEPNATFALGIDKPLYYSVHSASARLAPTGGALLHASRYLAPEEAADAEKVGEVTALVSRMQPGFEAEVVASARLIGMPVAYDFPRASAAGRMAPIALDDAPGVFLAGDWVGESAMLSDASAKSAREAAGYALAHVRRAAA
jgi:phytoene dehydrogenase-like protein